MNRDTQRVIDDERYNNLFPNTTLSNSIIRTVSKQGTYHRNTDIFEVVGHKGTYRATGAGGGITGMGAKYAILDDIIKNRQDANSESVRKNIWEWYTSTLYTRLSPDGRILIIMTRWHEDDIVGRLISRQHEEDGESWRVISFPAIAEKNREDKHPEDTRSEGEALWENRFSKNKLMQIKAAIGSNNWAGLYQQRPAPAEGAIFLRDWWRWYEENPLKIVLDMEEVIMSWDLSFKDKKDSDYVVGQVWGKRKADRFLLDQIRARMDFPKTLKAICNMKLKWPIARKIYIEDKANGPAVISTLQRDIQGIIPVNPEGGKIVRANAVTGQIESGNVWLPIPRNASWVGDFVEECSAFPNSVNDDQVDSMTQALIHMVEDDAIETWRKLSNG
jgi:predicted phage terminase large subunit-like protein